MPPIPPVPVRNSSLLLTVALSLLIGGASGGLVGYSVAMNPTSTAIVGTPTTIAVEEDSATVDVVTKASPAVVSIIITKDYSKVFQNSPYSPFDDFFFGLPTQQPEGKQEVGGGTGFIVSADGTIVTNKHVVDDDEAEYTVVLNDGKRYDAKVVAKDPTNDVAILKIEATELPTLTLGDSDKVQSGQTVLAIGNALGQYRNTVTKGIISGKSRTITASDSSGQSETLEDVFQTDAAINPGNSGGPLLDLAGSVVAINTAVSRDGQLIGFAIPIAVVKRDLESVRTSGKIVRPYLGVRYVVITDSLAEKNSLPVKTGALVQRGTNADELAVIPASPADKAGIVENDILTKINGKEINSDHSLIGLLSAFKPGDTITVEVYSKGEKKDVKVTLEEKT